MWVAIFSVDCLLCCAAALWFELAYFFLSCLRFWCHSQEIIAKINVKKVSPYIFS